VVAGVEQIDWTQPWLAQYRSRGEPIACSARNAPVAAALRSAAGLGVPRFVAHDQMPDGVAYEAFIAQTGSVPTRDDLHDFFNGIVWLHFPETKRRLNRLQAQEIGRTGIGATRGPLRDALTLFDENGAVLDAPTALWDALLARDWHRLFVTERAAWREARLLVFGHALLEKLMAPRKSATAHVLRWPAGLSVDGIDDATIAAALDPLHLAAKPFTPLPVLGIPGWYKGNCDHRFYDDRAVFRPPRAVQNTTIARPA
jgi:hypothetical protein